MKIFLFVIFYYKFLVGASQFLSLENLSNSLTPPEKVNVVYEREKRKIFSFVRRKFYFIRKVSAEFGEYPVIIDSLIALLNLETGELLRAMLNDDTDNLLVFFLYSFRDRKDFLIFTNTTELYSPRTNTFRRTNILKKFFDNFRCHLSFGISKSKPSNWTEPSNSLNGYNILELFRDIWLTKLKPLGRKMVRSEEMSNKEKLIEERLTFLGIFLAHRTEDLLIWEHPKIFPDIKGINYKIPPSISNFSFLCSHFKRQLEDAEYSELILLLRRLVSQSSSFLIHFFYFKNFKFWDNFNFVGILLEQLIKPRLELDLELRTDKVVIFGKKVDRSFEGYDELRKLVKEIISKTKTAP